MLWTLYKPEEVSRKLEIPHMWTKLLKPFLEITRLQKTWILYKQ